MSRVAAAATHSRDDDDDMSEGSHPVRGGAGSRSRKQEQLSGIEQRKARKNSRERARRQDLKEQFDALAQILGLGEKVEKSQILSHAVERINYLELEVAELKKVLENTTTAVSGLVKQTHRGPVTGPRGEGIPSASGNNSSSSSSSSSSGGGAGGIGGTVGAVSVSSSSNAVINSAGGVDRGATPLDTPIGMSGGSPTSSASPSSGLAVGLAYVNPSTNMSLTYTHGSMSSVGPGSSSGVANSAAGTGNVNGSVPSIVNLPSSSSLVGNNMNSTGSTAMGGTTTGSTGLSLHALAQHMNMAPFSQMALHKHIGTGLGPVQTPGSAMLSESPAANVSGLGILGGSASPQPNLFEVPFPSSSTIPHHHRGRSDDQTGISSSLLTRQMLGTSTLSGINELPTTQLTWTTSNSSTGPSSTLSSNAITSGTGMTTPSPNTTNRNISVMGNTSIFSSSLVKSSASTSAGGGGNSGGRLPFSSLPPSPSNAGGMVATPAGITTSITTRSGLALRSGTSITSNSTSSSPTPPGNLGAIGSLRSSVPSHHHSLHPPPGNYMSGSSMGDVVSVGSGASVSPLTTKFSTLPPGDGRKGGIVSLASGVSGGSNGSSGGSTGGGSIGNYQQAGGSGGFNHGSYLQNERQRSSSGGSSGSGGSGGNNSNSNNTLVNTNTFPRFTTGTSPNPAPYNYFATSGALGTPSSSTLASMSALNTVSGGMGTGGGQFGSLSGISTGSGNGLGLNTYMGTMTPRRMSVTSSTGTSLSLGVGMGILSPQNGDGMNDGK